MSETKVKTPAQLKAEQIKAANKNKATAKQENTENTDVTDETSKLKAQLEEANRIAAEAEKKAKTLEAENKKLVKQISDWSETVITKDVLEADETDKKPKPIGHEYFTITVTNKSLSYAWFQFKKWEKYAITGRNKKAILELIERKLWKIVKS